MLKLLTYTKKSVIKQLNTLIIAPPSLGTYALNGLEVEDIFVPSQSVASYQSTSGWSEYAEKVKAIA